MPAPCVARIPPSSGAFALVAVLLVALFMTLNLVSSATAPEELTFNQFVELARGVYRNNDERSRLKRDINKLLGSRLIEEKSYAPY